MELTSRSSDRRTLVALCLVLVLAILAVYGQVATHEYTSFDDPLYITENEYVLRGLSLDGLRWAFTTTTEGNWIPVSWLTHMVAVEIFGPEPGAHLLINVFIHAASSTLLLLVLAGMTRQIWPSAMAAALFALHPLHVESVAWAAERKDVLCGLFWMLTMVAYWRYTLRPSILRYSMVAGLLLLGLMSKSMLVTLPIVLLLLDFWPLRRLRLGEKGGVSWQRLVVEKIPLMMLSLGVSLVTFVAQNSVGSVGAAGPVSLGARVLSVLAAYGVYVRQTFWPLGLAVFYPQLSPDELRINALFGLSVIGTGLGLSVWMMRRRPYVSMGSLWFLGVLVPVSGVVQIGLHGHADRYTYLPHIGLFIVLSWATAELSDRGARFRMVVSALVVSMVLGLSIRSWDQVRHWRDEKNLFEHALEVTTGNDTAHNMYAHALLAEQNLADAAYHFGQAVELDPDRVIYRYNLGLTEVLLGRDDAAKAAFYAALELDPEHTDSRYRLANLLLRNDRLAAAAGQFMELVSLEPSHVDGRINLGLALAQMGRTEEAERHFLEALRWDPTNAGAHYNYGLLLAKTGRTRDAIEQLRLALEVRPNHAETHRQLGVLYRMIGEADTGQGHADRAAQLGVN